MESNSKRTPPEQPHPTESPAPKKRFRIVRLEERIAPKKGGNGTNNGCAGSSTTETVSVASIY